VDQGVTLFALNAAGTITACEGTLGFAAEATVGQSIFALYQDDPHSLDQVRRALAGEVVTFASQWRGTAIEQRLVPQREGAVKVTGLIGMARDVPASRAVEEALRASEARFPSLGWGAPVGACIMDEHGIFEEVNEPYAALLGYQPEELVRQALPDGFPAAGACRSEGRLRGEGGEWRRAHQ
jgi:PAS domain-containing protein